MRIVLLGAPGTGKGTQAVVLAKELNIPHISTGDIFRYNIKNNTELGKLAKQYIDKGLLVPDEVTMNIVKDRLGQPDCKKGFILDGFPRTIAQAEYLDKALYEMNAKTEYCINFELDNDTIVKRISGRRVCIKCGASYNVDNKPPKKSGICDECSSEVIQRDDDKEETIRERLRVYEEQTKPLIDYYSKKGLLSTVFSQGLIENTTKQVMKVLGKVK